MNSSTGKTIYEQILSLDVDNNPVSGATFDIAMYKNGLTYTGLTVGMSVSDASRGIYSASWSASTIGDYQMYVKNNLTGIIFIADNVSIKSDDEINTNIYIGL